MVVEAVDSAFRARELLTDSATFRTQGPNGCHAEFLGDDYRAYKVRCEAQTLGGKAPYPVCAHSDWSVGNQDVDTVWRELVTGSSTEQSSRTWPSKRSSPSRWLLGGAGWRILSVWPSP